MKLAFIALMLGQTVFAETPKPPATPPVTIKSLQDELESKNKEIDWLQQVLKSTQDKLDALAKYYSANELLIRLDQIKPLVKPDATKGDKK